MEQLAAAAAAQGSDFMGGWGGGGTLWQAARGAAQSTASARRGCRPAPLTLLCTRAGAALAPGEAGLSLRNCGSGSRTPTRPEGTVPSRFEKGAGKLGR